MKTFYFENIHNFLVFTLYVSMHGDQSSYVSLLLGAKSDVKVSGCSGTCTIIISITELTIYCDFIRGKRSDLKKLHNIFRVSTCASGSTLLET